MTVTKGERLSRFSALLDENGRHFDQIVTPQEFGAVGDGVTDDTAAIQAAIDTGKVILFDESIYLVTSTLSYTNVNGFIGRGINNTIIKYRGPADTFAFKHSFTGDGSDQFPGRVFFADFTIDGDGTVVKGTDATVNGISVSDESANLINIPWYSLRRVKFNSLKYGIQLEGYAHVLEDCWSEKCSIGFDFVHPEQVSLNNCWANQCDIGLQSNIRKQKFGHRFIIEGGAYQRCRVGISLWNTLEPRINTYLELNEENDIILGDPADPTNFTKGCKNIVMDINTASDCSVGRIDMYACVEAQILFQDSGTAATPPFNVRANGFCKYITVEYPNETANLTATSWTFQGNSVLTSLAKFVDGAEDHIPLTITGADLTTGTGDAEFSYYKVNRETVKMSGNIIAGAAPGSIIGKVPVGYRPATDKDFTIPYFSGSWNIAVFSVKTNGDIQIVSGGGASRTFFVADIEYNI